MKIGVLIKQVPARDSELIIDSEGGWIDESGVEFETSESDDYALEAGLRLKEDQGGELVAISLGPPRVEKALRAALAKGADRAIHLVEGRDYGLDPLQVAGAFAAVARDESFDLVLSGLQSDDRGFGQTSILLADMTGAPHATLVVGAEIHGDSIRVKRELEEGWYQSVDLPLPAVLAIQSGIFELRYTSLKGIMAARKKEVREIPAAELMPTDLSAGMEITRLYVPEKIGGAEMLGGSPGEQAAALVEKLRYSAKVL